MSGMKAKRTMWIPCAACLLLAAPESMAKPQDSTSDEGLQITAAITSSPHAFSDADVRLVITNSTPRRIVMHHPSAPGSKGSIIVHQRLPSGKMETWGLNACPGDLIID